MARRSSLLPITKADIKVSKAHLKATMKLEAKKVVDHERLARIATDPGSKAYNKEHAKVHKKNIKADMKHLKKIAKARSD